MGRLFDWISDIQKAVTSKLNTIEKDDFYKGIQKLYDSAKSECSVRMDVCRKLNNKSVISFTQIVFYNANPKT